jgi:hypothetical protein
MCWRRSRVHWRDRVRCISATNVDAGRKASTFVAELARTARCTGGHAGVELLALGKRHGWDRLKQAMEESLALGCTDAAAVRHLVTNELVRSRTESFELSGLERYDRPLPEMHEYDLLLGVTTTGAEVAR